MVHKTIKDYEYVVYEYNKNIILLYKKNDNNDFSIIVSMSQGLEFFSTNWKNVNHIVFGGSQKYKIIVAKS